MKSTFITLTAVASLVGYTNAALVFKDPWAQSKTWKSGEKAHISWTSSDTADADNLCDIQMLNGEAKNSNIVATVTNPDQPIKCGVHEFEIVPLNDFKTGKYWLRIGQAKTNTWTYSGVFNFEGKGTAYPLKLADGTNSDYPTAEAPQKDNGITEKEKEKEKKGEKNESKEEIKKEKKKEEKKERKEAAPKLASQGSSSASEAKATGSASPSKSSLILSPTGSSSKGNMASPVVKKDTENDKKAHSAAVSNVLVSHSIVLGLASFAAYFFI